jgi:hypothetical protein
MALFPKPRLWKRYEPREFDIEIGEFKVCGLYMNSEPRLMTYCAYRTPFKGDFRCISIFLDGWDQQHTW